MTSRSSQTELTFRHPFRLAALESAQPAGTYLVVTEEEQIENLSFSAFHRTATLLHLPALGVPSAIRQVITVDPDELARAHAADGRRAESPT